MFQSLRVYLNQSCELEQFDEILQFGLFGSSDSASSFANAFPCSVALGRPLVDSAHSASRTALAELLKAMVVELVKYSSSTRLSKPNL